MRKELKIIGSRERHVFTATFIRFGFRDGYKGPVKTILLQDVLLDDKIVVFICFLLWLIFTLLLSFTVIGLVISVSDEWQEMGDKIIDKL